MPVPTAAKPGILTTTPVPPSAAAGGKRPSGPISSDESLTMPSPKGIQHVDRSKLYTDVIYRVKFVAALVGFTKDDQVLVAELAPKIEPLLPAFIDTVYEQLFQFDVLAESFLNRMQGFNGQVVYKLENLSINSEQITFRRSMLLKYFVRSMRSMSDFDSLIPYLDWVAAIHSKQSFIPIEFIHCNGLLGFMSGELIKLVAQLHLPQDRTIKAQAAMTRMLWVQNDLFAMHNVSDGQEFQEAHLASPLKTEPEKNNVMPPVHPEQKAKRRQSFGVSSMATSASGTAAASELTCLFAGGAVPAHVTPTAVAETAANAPTAAGQGQEGEACEMTGMGSGGNGAAMLRGAPSTRSGRESLATTFASDTTVAMAADVGERVKCPIDRLATVNGSGKIGVGQAGKYDESSAHLLSTGENIAATEQDV